ncbi:MAG TPA: dUTP diphosphatase [Stellaceae bacterium]|nr:dUTP diphosphatase [Stellaceae bacterium]
MSVAALAIELKILDPRLAGWGFPLRGSELAAGLDLFACIERPLVLEPQAAPQLISAGFALSIGSPEWCALVLPRSGLGHRRGLVLGNSVGVIDADYEGPCLISAWNRNREGDIVIAPGDRIAQLVVTRIAQPQFIVVTEFSGSSGRQQAGFGSTGVSAACPAGREEGNS